MSKRAAKIFTPGWIVGKAAGLRKYLGFPVIGFVHPMDALDRVVSKPLHKSGTVYGDYEIVPDCTRFILDGNTSHYVDKDGNYVDPKSKGFKSKPHYRILKKEEM